MLTLETGFFTTVTLPTKIRNLKKLAHILVVIVLTLVTQIGGLIWIINFGLYRIFNTKKSNWIRLGTFLVLYSSVTFFIIPPIAKSFGRVPLPISKSGNLRPHNFITPILNRHYVRPQLRTQLIKLANRTNTSNNKLKLSYLDANFPFINGFPLLPHLSHSDGRKVDLSFYYTKNSIPGNHKPSNSGYGQFVEPLPSEYNQTKQCKSKGYWQYDFTRFLTLGSRNDLEFDATNTKQLIRRIVSDPLTQKVFIEPHLKTRMKLSNKKIRFHGCQAVRHDDHIHLQIVW